MGMPGRTRPTTLEAVRTGIVGCDRCRRLRTYCGRIAEQKKREFRSWSYWGKPVPGFGDPQARLLIVGLAPAAHGGNRTGRVFTGDSSGDWLYEALYRFGFANQPLSRSRDDGLQLSDCYVTAAARCAPPDNRPTAQELDRCLPWLVRELALLPQIRVIMGLGRIAREAWLRASGWWDRLPPRDRPTFGHCDVTTMPDGTVFIASYHPSRQNTNTGRLTRAMWYRTFREARGVLDRLADDPASGGRWRAPVPGPRLRSDPAPGGLMPVQRLKEFLDQHQVKYVVISHSRAFTSQEIAAATHIPGKELAKSVIVEIDGKMAMAVLPGSQKVDVDLLRDVLGAQRVTVAKEGAFRDRFPECDLGAMPPFGNLYGMPVYVADTLTEDEEIAFSAGSHTEVVRMRYRDFERLVRPQVIRFAVNA